MSVNTVVTLVTDLRYLHRATRTIKDIRTKGEWTGTIVLICVDFKPDDTLIEQYNLTIYQVPYINTSKLLEQVKLCPIYPIDYERHIVKIAQWNKLCVFDDYFRQWERVVFFDAGLRIVGSLEPLLNLPWKGKILAPEDSSPRNRTNRFGVQLDLESNSNVVEQVKKDFGYDIFDKLYLLNCMWVYDTSLLDICSRKDLEEGMNKYPICRNNEMSLMNLYFTFLHKVWTPLPEKTSEDKYLFGWCELEYFENPHYSNFHFIKYPVTLKFDNDP